MGCAGSRAASVAGRGRGVLDLSKSEHDGLRKNLVWIHEADLSTKYEIIETLGRGSAGEVFIVQRNQAASSCSAFELNKLAVDEPCEKKLVAGSQSDSPVEAIMPAPTGRTTATPPTLKRRRFAMKTFYLDRIDNSLLREFENEIKLLQELHHPHIISLKEVFLDRKRTRVCMLMDLCRGGDLGSVGIMNEIQACTVITQVLRALAYLHDYAGICHRDLKLENVVLENAGEHIHVRLIDFGISQKFGVNEKMRGACGTVYTMAPEMLAEGGYTQKADMWSVGVMTCMILCGEPPFLKNEDDLLDEKKVERLRMAKYTFATPLWKKVSPEAKGLIGSLLKKAPGYRLSAKEALHYCEHIWMKAVTSSEGAPPSGSPGKHNSKDPMLLSRIATSMRSFAEYSTVKKVALMIAAFQLDTEEISVLRDAFLEIDADRSGLITVEELAEALKSQNMNEAEVRRVFAGIDQDKSNKLHWTEFLAATLEMVGEVEEERLLDAFERMDVDNTGSISNSDLQRLMGSSHTPEMISDMLRETQAGEGIDFFQFRELLKCTTPVASLPAVATPDQSSLPQESVEASPNAS